MTFFDAEVAGRYDVPVDEMNSPSAVAAAVDFLVGLVGDRRALEFAVGTGRIALPLSARGVTVHGIDVSHPRLTC